MNRRRIASLLSACLLLFIVPPDAFAAPDSQNDGKQDGKPSIFADLPLAEAIERNATDGRTLVVKATAVWCGPCKRMDATTWRDEAVVEWFREKGTALSLDVDHDPDGARRLRIRAMPTMVAFRGGEEVDRVVGYRSGKDLLEWLATVERGETLSTRLETMLAAPREGPGAMSMQQRLELARELTEAGRHEEAADEYVWLWSNMTRVDPSMVGVRSSFMVGSMERLAKESDAARERLTALREDVAERRKAEPRSGTLLMDWVVLNGVIGDDEATLAWFDEAKARPGAAKAIERMRHHLEPPLKRNGRWADLGRIDKKPLDRLKSEAATMRTMLTMQFPQTDDTADVDEQTRQMREFAMDNFRAAAGRLYACLLAAERTDDAADVASEAIRLDPEDPERMAQSLVAAAVSIGVADAAHRDLLAERPLPEQVRATHGDTPPERLSAEARAARRTEALKALEVALRAAEVQGN